MKIGLVLEGGAKRGAFTAGTLEYLKDKYQWWDYIIGVSAGGGNAFNYIAGENRRTLKVINPGRGNAYIGWGNLFRHGTYVYLDKMVYDYTYKTFPIDIQKYFDNPVDNEFVAVCCETGKPVYFSEKENTDRLLKIVKATCSVPILCDPVEIDGMHYLDGSVIDAIPYKHALEKCDKVVVIMTRTAETKPTNYGRFKIAIKAMYKKYPAMVDCLMRRTENYNNQLKGLDEGVKDGKIFLIRPEFNLSKFERSHKKIDEFFNHGFQKISSRAEEFAEFIKDK